MTLDDKGRRLLGRLEFFDRNVTQLTRHMTQIVAHHKEHHQVISEYHVVVYRDVDAMVERPLYDRERARRYGGIAQGIEFSTQVKNIAAQEPFADLQDRLMGFADVTERIALERKSIMFDRAKSEVVKRLARIKRTVIEPTQALLQDRESCVRALLKAEEKDADDRGRGLREGTSLTVLEHRHQLMNAEATVDNNFELFETQRVEEVKEILEEFLRCELYYHCRALEMLAPALLHIEGVDAESARESMREDIEGMNKHLDYNYVG